MQEHVPPPSFTLYAEKRRSLLLLCPSKPIMSKQLPLTVYTTYVSLCTRMHVTQAGRRHNRSGSPSLGLVVSKPQRSAFFLSSIKQFVFMLSRILRQWHTLHQKALNNHVDLLSNFAEATLNLHSAHARKREINGPDRRKKNGELSGSQSTQQGARSDIWAIWLATKVSIAQACDRIKLA